MKRWTNPKDKLRDAFSPTKSHELKYIRYRYYILHYIIFGVILALTILTTRISVVTSNEYAIHAYSRLVRSQYYLFGGAPFPVINIVLILLEALVLYTLGRLLYLILRYHHTAARFRIFYHLKKMGLNYACGLFVIAILFMFTKGMLYPRIDFATAHNLSTSFAAPDSVSDETLLQYYQSLSEQAAALCERVNRDNAGYFQRDSVYEDTKILADTVVNAFSLLNISYPGILDDYPTAKADWPLGITSLTGSSVIANPFTAEVVYNTKAADILLPYALCYETAKFSGYVTDCDVAYIAYEACMASGSADFAYSATVCTLKSVCKELTRRSLAAPHSLPVNVQADLDSVN